MQRLGTFLFYSQFVLFLCFLFIFIAFRDKIQSWGLDTLILFLLYTTGLPSLISILVLLVKDKDEKE